MQTHLSKLYGLSLIEILATVTIITILCSASVYSYQEHKTKTLYSNSINLMEQNKFYIYSYFSKYKSCPDSNTINQSLSNSYLGTRIINNNCDLVLCKNSEEIIALNATINNDLTTALSDGIQYTCNFPSSNTGSRDVAKYLPQCTVSSNTSRCS